MGTTPKKLDILLTDQEMIDWPEVQELASKGHLIKVAEFEVKPDVILGPQCWRMGKDARKYFKLAIDEARKVRYPNTKAGPAPKWPADAKALQTGD